MKFKRIRKFKVWSTFFFFWPFIIALNYRIWLMAAILGGIIIVCFLYHLADEKHFYLIDRVLAWLLILENLYLCYLGKFLVPYFSLALLFAFIAIFLQQYLERKGNYNIYHGFWHIFAVLITICSLLAYINY